jgi:class 3 adenylate cyclase
MSGAAATTVTFLATDVEGSTRLWEQHPDRMDEVMRWHHRVIDTVAGRHGGRVFETAGDSAWCAFTSAVDAVTAAIECQVRLRGDPPHGIPLAVRMALHSVEGTRPDGSFTSLLLNRVARLLAVAHGGQILLSDLTTALASRTLPPSIGLRDLGRHRLA